MLSILLLIAAVASHVLPHPWWNFTAVGGALLVWGARRPLASVFIPVLALAASDWYLTQIVYGFQFRVDDYLVTWTWYAFAVLIGFVLLSGKPGFLRCVTAAVAGPTSFFLVSNYAVWAVPSSWYPHTASGFAACYTAALPFYRNDLVATGIIVALVWGAPALARRHTPSFAPTHITD